MKETEKREKIPEPLLREWLKRLAKIIPPAPPLPKPPSRMTSPTPDMFVMGDPYDPTKRRYFVSEPQYTVMKRNQEFCVEYRAKGRGACERCKTLNFEKWHLCHTVPVMDSDKPRREWKWRR